MTTTLLHDNVNDNDNEDDKSQYYYDVLADQGWNDNHPST